MARYSLQYSTSSRQRALEELLEYKMILFVRNLLMLPFVVIAMLLAFSNVKSGQMFTSLRGILTFVYFVGLVAGMVIFPVVKLFWDARKCRRIPRELYDVHVLFFEDYMEIQWPTDIRRIYYCDTAFISHSSKYKRLQIQSSFNSDLKPVRNAHFLTGYTANIPFADTKEETITELEQFLRQKGVRIKYE